VYAEVGGDDVYAGLRGDFVGQEVNWNNLKHVLMVRPSVCDLHVALSTPPLFRESRRLFTDLSGCAARTPPHRATANR
jgi:hypothetical protein